MLSITPFLWFDTQAEEAMQFYTSIFPRSKVIAVHRAGDAVMSVTWELEGQRFMGLNAGPHFTFNEAVSFFVACETQSVDEQSESRQGEVRDKDEPDLEDRHWGPNIH